MATKGIKSNNVDFTYLDDKKLDKGKKKVKESAEAWKGPSHKERREEAAHAKEAMRRRSRDKDDKVSWKKKAAGIAAVLFLCGAGLFNFLSVVIGAIAGDGVTVLDVQDTAKLKEVLFGGEPWLVYCVNNQTQNQRLPKVLEDSAWSLKRSIGLRVGVLACWDQTESGRSVAQRFKLRPSPPLAFLVANGNKPRTMNLQGVSKAEDIEKKAKPALKLDIHRIDSLKRWPSHCTSRRTCIVVGHKHPAQKDTALNVIRPLIEYHRRVSIVTLDTSFWQLKLDDAVMKTRPPKEKGGRADVLCLSRNEGPKKGNGTHSGNFLHELDSRSASSFFTACEKRENLVAIGVPPRIVARPSKPKKVTVPPPSPPPKKAPAPPPRKDPRSSGGSSRSNVDQVGSRAAMEAAAAEEALFEAVEEEPETESEEEASEESEEVSSDEDEDVSEDDTSESSEDEVEL